MKREVEKKPKTKGKYGNQLKSETEQLPVNSSRSSKGEAGQNATKPCLDLTSFPVRFQHIYFIRITDSVSCNFHFTGVKYFSEDHTKPEKQ